MEERLNTSCKNHGITLYEELQREISRNMLREDGIVSFGMRSKYVKFFVCFDLFLLEDIADVGIHGVVVKVGNSGVCGY